MNIEKQMYFPDCVIIADFVKDKYSKRIDKIISKIQSYTDINVKTMTQSEIDELFLKGYNIKEKYLILTENTGVPVKKCPGTLKYLCCNYYTINLYVNCNLGCHYCFLQFYLKNPILTIFLNIGDMFEQFEQLNKNTPIKRIGTGELGDSLLLDPFTDFSIDFINFFKKYPDTYFEFKTKTNNIDNLLKVKGSKNIVASFSLNTYKMVNEAEEKTSSIKHRIKCAKVLANHGYSIAFHFDPIFIYNNYIEEYKEILELIQQNISKDNIVWISLGTFRYHPDMKDILRNNYKDEIITKKETILGLDNKIRYFVDDREKTYSFFINFFRENYNIPVYLCMESKKVWQDVYGDLPNEIDNLSNIFKM